MARLVPLLLAALLASSCGPAPEATEPPNILFILIDDLGYTGISSFGNRHVHTPNIDSLAGDGMTLTAAYVQPQCSPTRAALLTGQSTARNNFWHVVGDYGYPWAPQLEPVYETEMPRGLPTYPKLLQQAGYTTGIFGKWHLNRTRDTAAAGLAPEAAHHYGFDTAGSKHPSETDDKAVSALTQMAIDFIAGNRERRFFCFLSHFSVHTTVAAPQALIDEYVARGYPPAGPDQNEGVNNATYLAMIKHLDNEIGRLLAFLDDNGLRENTLVIFLSDNGGVLRCFSNLPLRHGKGSLYEGGVRVPMLVRWPGVVKPGSVSESPVHAVDFYPTFAGIAGAKLPDPASHPLDGASFLPLLRGEDREAKPVYWHAPLYDLRWGTTPAGAVRDGDYKLIEYFGDYVDIEDGNRYLPGRRVELFNLAADPGERNNLAETEPEKRDELLGKLRRWRESAGAKMPVPNPNHDFGRALQQVGNISDYR